MEEAQAERPVPVEVVAVKREDMVTGLAYSGTVQDEYSAILSAKVSTDGSRGAIDVQNAINRIKDRLDGRYYRCIVIQVGQLLDKQSPRYSL